LAKVLQTGRLEAGVARLPELKTSEKQH